MSDPRSEPPDLPGYTYLGGLGAGGFADVFLYHHHNLKRDVAIKVLRPNVQRPDARRAFKVEANLMARVSRHPYIVTVYDVGDAPDGRPFMAMECYSQPHYGDRAKTGGISVDQVLELGVLISSAVEYAHKADVMHRDIKPANILVNDLDWPGLTDFGIAGARADDGEQAGQGFTPAYSAPEVVSEETAGEETADIYSLAATLYAILAGRSPFADASRPLDKDEMKHRVLTEPVPRIARPDVPESLQNLLVQAMAKKARDRPGSARQFALSLRSIQQELLIQPTRFDMPSVPTSENDLSDPTRDADRTLFRDVPPLVAGRSTAASSVLGAAPPLSVRGSAPAVDEVLETEQRSAVGREVAAPVAPLPSSDTAGNGSTAAHSLPPTGRVTPRRSDGAPTRVVSPRIAVAAITLLAAVAAGAILLAVTGGNGGELRTNTTVDEVPELLGDAPPAPSGVTVRVAESSLEVSWAATDRRPGDRYVVSAVGAPNAAPLADVEASPVMIDEISGRCVQVVAVRGSYVSEPATGCVS